MRRREEVLARRAEFAARWGAWPKLGSYAWIVSGAKTATGYPWLGGFPQTGIQTPSIMHFAENRSAEGSDHRIAGIGMEFAGAPLVLIGQTDSVAYTTTTAQLRLLDTFFEQLVSEDTDALRYDDEGTPAPLSRRTEVFKGAPPATHVFWRSHERGGNKGSRAIIDFRGDAEGAAGGATASTLTKTGAFAGSFGGGYVAIVDGTGAGQMRAVASADADTLTLANPWTTIPDTKSVFVAVKPGHPIVAAALDSVAWQEESTAVLGFSTYQRAETILDVRAGARIIPTTHNFLAADNKPFNGIGTAGGTAGNIGYWSSGFSRVRQGGLDPRLPLDGTVANPLVVASGTVASGAPTTLTATSATFTGKDFSPPAPNFRYLHPSQQGKEFVVSITSGPGAKQTRRIASNTATALTVEAAWGVVPAAGDAFEVYEIVAIPEAINPAEGYTANWNNKAATADEGSQFGREFRHSFILERLAAENSWNRTKSRQLNKDLAGLDGKGKLGRFLLPRLRQAVNGIGNLGNPAVDTVLAALEAHNAAPLFGRSFIDPVAATTTRGEVAFMNDLINQLATAIYGDEYSGAIGVPDGKSAFNLVQHAIDSAAGDPPGAYVQSFSGSYFGGDWRSTVVGTLSALASGGLPPDAVRPMSTYRHPLAALSSKLVFEPTPAGNRGTYEQIIDVGPVVNGEFIFPLGQSGLITGNLASQTVDPNFTTLHPLWRDWRFAPMLHVGQDLATNPTGDSDGDGVLDAYERWYFGDLSHGARDDSDHDRATLLKEFRAGTDPTVADTDGDGIPDGQDALGQDRLRSGVLRTRGTIDFGVTTGTDRLNLQLDIGTGDAEFDPATRAILLTLSDDNQIYMVTIPTGTMTPTSSGRMFTVRDPAGSNNGLTLARFRRANPGRKSMLEFHTGEVDLSNADRTNHDLSVLVNFGAHAISGTAQFTVRGRRGRIQSTP